MNAIWAKVKPHVLSWHMVPCLVMLVAAVGVASTTGQPSRVPLAVGCMFMMMAAMGHNHGSPAGHDHSRHDHGDAGRRGRQD